jgi:Mrp family chromosome partitioning ATPase
MRDRREDEGLPGWLGLAPRREWPGSEEAGPREGIARWLDIIGARWWFVLGLALLAGVTAYAIVPSLQQVYQAEATLLVEPIPSSDDALLGLGLPRESSDPTRDVETASQLIATPEVAARVAAKLHLATTPQALLKKVDAVPVAQSNVVAVTAKADSAALATRLANGFAQGAIDERTARLHAELDQVIPRLRRQIAVLGPNGKNADQPLVAKLQELQTLRGGQDPTLHIASPASVPRSPVAPRRGLSVAAAVIAGLLIGSALALGSELLDPRLRREEELRRYRLPILARVPRAKQRRVAGRGLTSYAILDSYQLLGTAVASSGETKLGRSVVVTGPTPSTGKTTTALHLAAALAELDQKVVLVEADARQPSLSHALGVAPRSGVGAVLTGEVALQDALVEASHNGLRIQALLQGESDSRRPALSGGQVELLLWEAKALADWVVIDAPPPNYISDGLTVAKHGDLVVLVTRLGRTRNRELAELAELFVHQRILPLGFVVIGTKEQQPYLISARDDVRSASAPRGNQGRGVIPDNTQTRAVDA